MFMLVRDELGDAGCWHLLHAPIIPIVKLGPNQKILLAQTVGYPKK